MNNQQIVPNQPYTDIVDIPQVLEYIDLAFQIVPLADKTLDLVRQLENEKTTRVEIRENAINQRMAIERRMNQLDAELEADLETNKTIVSTSMRVFEKMVEDGHIEQAMIVHERIISRLSGRVSLVADKYNDNNPDGQVKFYTS